MLLHLLHGIQETIGNIPNNVTPDIAHALKQCQAEVCGVINFYHDFRNALPVQNVLRLCRAESSRNRDAEKTVAQLRNHLQRDDHRSCPTATSVYARCAA